MNVYAGERLRRGDGDRLAAAMLNSYTTAAMKRGLISFLLSPLLHLIEKSVRMDVNAGR